MAEHNVCPHAPDTWEREPALYSSRCPECKDRVCTRCRRYGSEDGGLPLVSWMTGLCEGCSKGLHAKHSILGRCDCDIKGCAKEEA